MSGVVDVLVGALVLVLSVLIVLGFVFLCWGIIWKVLLSRLGLFKELFNGLSVRNSPMEEDTTERRKTEIRQLKSSLSTRHRTKDGSTRSTKTVTFDSTGTSELESDRPLAIDSTE